MGRRCHYGAISIESLVGYPVIVPGSMSLKQNKNSRLPGFCTLESFQIPRSSGLDTPIATH